MNLDKTIIFCQAPADVPYVLKLYEQLKEKHSISIFVINVEGVFRFLFDLKLDLEKLVFIPYELRTFRNLLLINIERKRINFLWVTLFCDIHRADVYFFSRFEDWLTSAFIDRFAKNKQIQITYINYYDNSATLFPIQKIISLRSLLYLSILKYLTGVNFKAKIKEKLPEFPVDKYLIKESKGLIDESIFAKYSFNVSIDKSKSNLLFFISPCEVTVFDQNYYNDKIIESICIFKKNGYKVIVKGHPRMGIPEEICRFADYVIPSYVPGEFLNMCNFNICFGIDTTAICYFSKNNILPTYTLIKLFPYSNKDLFEVFIKYMIQQSNNEIQFIDNVEELEKIALKYLYKENDRK